MTKQVAIGVGGRFHAEELALALLASGYSVHLYTSLLPKHFSKLHPSVVHSFPRAEIFFRGAKFFGQERAGANWKMQAFGRYLAKTLRFQRPDVLIAWSSFAKEAFEARIANRLILERNSSHISEQIRALQSAHQEFGIPFPDHSFVEQRELCEYELADRIAVLSETSAKTFESHGISRSKIFVQHGGIHLQLFKPRTEPRKPGPLRVIYFGAISLRKGIPDLLQAFESIPKSEATLTLLGDISPEMAFILSRFPKQKILPSLPHERLAPFLQQFDAFVFPTLEDGFGYVVPQAMACGLIPIVSRASGASELIRDGVNGILIEPASASDIRRALDRVPLCNPMNNLGDLSWERYSKNYVRWFNGEPSAPAHQ